MTTFPQSRLDLQSNESLLNRISSALGMKEGSISVDNIWDRVWPHLNSFRLANEVYTRWYLMDEVGLAISHSNEPNIVCCPLYVKLANGQSPYTLSLAWPCRDISEGEILNRNFLYGFPWNPIDKVIWNFGFQYKEDLTEERDLYITYLNRTNLQKFELSKRSQTVPLSSMEWLDLSIQQTVRVFCDRPDHLNDSYIIDRDRIILVQTPEQADILYLIDHVIDANEGQVFEYSKSHKVSSQFCWNNLVITKEALAKTVRTAHRLIEKSSNTYPSWFPDSYDLTVDDELKKFISNFLKSSAEDGALNYWILKRHTGKQSIDYPISNNLSCLLRHAQIDRCVASKYINSPLLLAQRKFDLRYHVLVKSLHPLDLRCHEIFVIRWANHSYSSSDYEDYQKHFTVMNFLENDHNHSLSLAEVRGLGQRRNIHPNDFRALFNNENIDKGISWDIIQSNIDKMLRKLFEYVYEAFLRDDSMNDCHPNSCWTMNQQKNIAPARAMFGVDVLVDQNYQPYVLEVQWAPDCTRAIELRPNFWDEILGALYLDNEVATSKL